MRPVRLTLQAFGSYGGELCVDFGRLARHGIFAITGPTGAGKSTIFDALVYALYDDLPGFRVDGYVRSQYAGPDVETRVCLEFEAHGERWRVERAPTQFVQRRRGRGEAIEKKSTVVLQRLSCDGAPVPGSAISRKAAVADQIDAIVGLKKAEFEQVVLIPQGRFEEVLKADTRVRAPLLRRLFPVDVYGRVTARLKAIADERQRAFDDASRSYEEQVARLADALTMALAQAGPDGNGQPEEAGALLVEDMPRHLATLGQARAELGRQVTIAEAEHGESARALDLAQRAAEAWDRWQRDLSVAAALADEEADDDREATLLARARRVADLGGALRQWADATAALSELGPELAALRAEVEAAGAAVELPDSEELGSATPVGGIPGSTWLPAGTGAPADLRADALSDALSDARRASVLAQRLADEGEALQRSVARFDELSASSGALGRRRASLEGRRDLLGRRRAALAEEEDSVATLTREVGRLQELVRGVDAVAAAVERLEGEQAVVARRLQALDELCHLAGARDQARAETRTARTAVESVRASWRDGLAARLAVLLVDGDPCPTCGAVEHPRPAALRADAADDDALADAEEAYEAASERLRRLESRHAAAAGALRELDAGRAAGAVESELADRRAELAAVHEGAARLVDLERELAVRRAAQGAARSRADAEGHEIDLECARVDTEATACAAQQAAYTAQHGAFVSPAPRAALVRSLARDLDRLAELLGRSERLRATRCTSAASLSPLLDELGEHDPAALVSLQLDPAEIEARAGSLAARAELRREVRDRITAYEAGGGPEVRPDLGPFERAARESRERHTMAVGRQAVMQQHADFFSGGPALLETAAKEVSAARTGLEQARTLADRCAGLGGGASASRLSLENWVLADYLRQVLVQANERLATMTGGRFALRLDEGVADGRKPWGLDISVFDAYTGQQRPATTLSGGETFMAALALALGLADVVSGGSNREIGALFVDEGFGSLDPQALDAVLDVLRSLEDGGRLVGVVSHVQELNRALPSGIAVRTTAGGSVAEVHYPAD